jgi:hypothetical protein
MIGRRIVHHLKQQHWTGVFIELVIVILGVFIGLQVDNWNQQRQGHALEQQYLQRLHDDMKLSIETADFNIRDMRRQYRLEGDMLDALKSCRLEGAANIRFVAGAYALGKMDPPPLVRGTLDELRSTGRIGLIHDVHLRVQLARLVEDSNTFGRIFPMIMTRANPSIFYVNQRVQLNIPPERNGFMNILKHGLPADSVRFDFPALCKDPRFAAVISNVQELTLEVIVMNQQRRVSFRKLLQAIDNDLSGTKGT